VVSDAGPPRGEWVPAERISAAEAVGCVRCWFAGECRVGDIWGTGAVRDGAPVVARSAALGRLACRVIVSPSDLHQIGWYTVGISTSSGPFRIVYTVDDGESREITVTRVGHRREVYE
jgi:hypothetical protein